MKEFTVNLLKLVTTTMALVGVLTGCATAVVQEEFPLLSAGRFEITQTLTLERHGNSTEMLYYDNNNRLILQGSNGAGQVLSETTAQDARLSHTILHGDGSWLYAVWRPKLNKAVDGVGIPGDKLIYLRASPDGGKTFGPVQRLNQKGGAFKPFVASSGTGDVYVAYTDERNGGNLEIFLNVSHDRGQSWKQADVALAGGGDSMAVNPSLVAHGDHVYLAWMTASKDKKIQLFVRASVDKGETWLPPVLAHESVNQPGSPLMVKTAAGLLLCWSDADAVRCSSSTDHANSWSKSVPIVDSFGGDGLNLATDPKGRTHMLILKRPDTEQSKVNLFHAYSDGGTTFTSPQRLSGGELYDSTTMLPDLAFGEDGSVLATWVDLRYKRPVIAVNHSRDGGESWLKDSVVIAGKKGMYHFFPSAASAGNGAYTIAWMESNSRGNAATSIGQTEYRPAMRGVSMPPPDVELLKKRIDAFWSLREQEKWAEAYLYLDPFYREINSQSGYVKGQGMVKYYGHRVAGEPQVKGSRALVPLAYESEVPEMEIKGKKIAVARQEVTIQEEWIWVDGQWYQQIRDIMGKSPVID